MKRILAIGEILIDFTPIQSNKQTAYVPNPGGAPCNFLAMASRYGHETSFVGKVGQDHFGDLLSEALEDNQISTRYLKKDPGKNTTLAFVHLYEDGERDFGFYRKHCADIALSVADVEELPIEEYDHLHFGSLTFTDEPSRSAQFHLLDKAGENALTVSYDPNYRANLWENESTAVEYMLKGLEYADVVKVSEEELLLLSGEEDLFKGCMKIARPKTKIIVVTQGKDGVFYFHKDFCGTQAGYPAKPVDTTGAGDIFFGSFIASLLDSNRKLESIEEDELRKHLSMGNKAAAISVKHYGGMTSVPDLDMIKRFPG